MNCLVLTNRGLEDTSAEEIRQFIPTTKTETFPGRVSFQCTEQELANLCYNGKTFTKTVLLLKTEKIKELSELKIPESAVKFIDKTAVARCERIGNHDFTSFDAEKELNKQLAKYAIIDHKNPQTIFFALLDNNELLFGVDFAGIDLGRRDYRIFLGGEALKGNIAAAVHHMSGYKPEHVLLDPFCRHGTIAIEAAFQASNTSPHKYGKERLAFTKLQGLKYELKDEEKKFEGKITAMDENFRHVSAARKNAKIAGVAKLIQFSRTELEWIDVKFGKNMLDRITTLPVQEAKNAPQAERTHKQLIEQAGIVLKKTGKLTLIMKRNAEEIKKKAEEQGFATEQEKTIMQGEETLKTFVFSKEN